jgi:DNA-3-methyladenine glycosylase
MLVRLDDRGRRLSGLVIEAEAYVGTEDLGCHAHVGRTRRNASMWGAPGHAYVYFTYGMHWMLNVVTEREGSPAAVLIRGVAPIEGLRSMHRRRPGRPRAEWANGPAKLCRAFAIERSFDGHDLCRRTSRLFFERRPSPPNAAIVTGPRVGLEPVPEPWKSMPWRFRIHPEHVRWLVSQEEADEIA